MIRGSDRLLCALYLRSFVTNEPPVRKNKETHPCEVRVMISLGSGVKNWLGTVFKISLLQPERETYMRTSIQFPVQ